jgi:predicted nucleotidyltransferase component of viral defense system
LAIVKYKTAEAFRTALEQRLKNETEASGMALLRLRKRVAFERFLARLAASESSGWVLKGAFALELRLGLRTRTTKDIDLGRADDEEAATEHLNAATDIDLGDFFDFEVRRTPALDAATGFHAVRYTVRADLDGRRFEQFPVDVAFSEATPIQAEPLFGANSLEFADVAALQLPVVSLEQHVAEKLHAYTGAFGRDQRESTRVKDLIDLVLIGKSAEIDAERLRQALATTFEQRARQSLPHIVPLPPSSWARPYAALAREVGLAVDIEAGHAATARLLDPVLRSEAAGRWDPEARRWRSPA